MCIKISDFVIHSFPLVQVLARKTHINRTYLSGSALDVDEGVRAVGHRLRKGCSAVLTPDTLSGAATCLAKLSCGPGPCMLHGHKTLCAVDVFSGFRIGERFSDNHTRTSSMTFSVIGLRTRQVSDMAGLSSLRRFACRVEQVGLLTDLREVLAMGSHLRLRHFAGRLHVDVDEGLLSGCNWRQRVLWH